MAVGFTLAFGVLRVVNFWHGEAYMLGAVMVFYLKQQAGLNYWLAVLIAVLAVGALGWLSDKTIMRRFRTNLMGGAIATIGLFMIFQNATWFVVGGRPLAVSSVLQGNIKFLGVQISVERVVVIGCSFMVIAALGWALNRTKFGVMVRALQQDKEAAQIQGIKANRIYSIVFGVATGLAALAGALIAPIYSITPAMGSIPLYLTFIVVIVGGLGSVSGAFIASFIIGMQQSLTSAYWGNELALTVSFGLAMLVLIMMPKGLMGQE